MNASLREISRVLSTIGGVLLVIFGALELFGGAIGYFGHPMWTAPLLTSFQISHRAIIALICGIVALVGAKRSPDLAWDVILIIVGAIAGGIGGLLALMGGVIGIAAKYA